MLDQVSHGKDEGGKHVAWRVKKNTPLTEISQFLLFLFTCA